MPCLDDNTAVAYLRGQLSEKARSDVEAHVDTCSHCFAFLGVLARADALSSVGASTEGSPASVDDAEAQRPGARTSRLLERGARVGRYVVDGVLGAGGMGIVYCAYDPDLQRRIALKLLHPLKAGLSHEQRTARLLREARTMAQLSHPNVLAVHDVGIFGEQVFIAMDFVDGSTLTQWLRRSQRSWKEIVAVMRQAGRGLTAAHQSSIVHRDFKPDNVLIGHDGSVRVTDFGLARLFGREQSEEDDDRHNVTLAPEQGSADPAIGAATQAGALVGTPAYMAPEQRNGRAADARSDQYSFCVTAYEALFGARPGVAMSGVSASPLPPPTPSSNPEGSRRVPAWVRPALLRGLRENPAERYPSLDALLEVLDQDRRPRWHRWGLAAGIVILTFTSLAAILQSRHDQRLVCTGAERNLAGVWDESRRQAVIHAIRSTGAPYATDVNNGVLRGLDQYAREWTQMHTDACLATRVLGEQSEEALTVRMVCLDARLAELRALTGLLVHADHKTAERAVESVLTLTRLNECANMEALLAPLKLPTDPAVRARVQNARSQLAEAKVLGEAARYQEALNLAEAAEHEAQTLGYVPLEAEAVYRIGEIKIERGELDAAEFSLREAVWKADLGKHDELRARTLVSLTHLVGVLNVRLKEGRQLARQSEAVMGRLSGNREELDASLSNAVGLMLQMEGNLELAATHLRRAQELRESVFGPDHPLVAHVLSNLSFLLHQQGRVDDALQVVERVALIHERTVGPNHPDTAGELCSKGYILSSLGRQEEAIAAHEQSLAIYEHLDGYPQPIAARPLIGIALGLYEQGKYEESLSMCKRSEVVLTSSAGAGAQHPRMAYSLECAGDALAGLGRYQDAEAAHGRSIELFEKAYGVDSPHLTNPLTGLGLTLLATGRTEQAMDHLERALKLHRSHGSPQDELGRTLFGLAQAKWDSRRDREGARSLALEARSAYQKAGPGFRKYLVLVEEWLQQHP